MPRMHALELLPDEAGCDVVRRDWQALRDAGLPSQLDHRGATNSPHVTVVAAPALSRDDERRAAGLLEPLLPVELRASGLALLGGAKVSLVRLLDVPDELVRAVLELRSGLPDAQHLGWLPHLTLARRLPREDVGRALEVVGHEDVVVSVTSLRRWDPQAQIVTTL
ncbi:2'-5' RNA ligase family protein [Nocardioides hwasunensis]|uniref:2'-5' RNA ligase family protein n=1 Tax=Nocardioides hwasunensis TaxID=397258 RepID=A0ABR8MJC3_9ACTN|nr:2'-5' RNA ligase family protein [Nocardioides hwasunensis]MBD3915376.1 2'-5' RNA ligase family protein [Nocardioides hwasunensis]